MNVRTSLSALHQAALAPEHLEACLCLDQASLGGLWNRAQWQSELAEQRRPGVGLWQGQQLLAIASGWLVVDELHITVVAVDPEQRRRGLGQQVLKALLLEARQQGPCTPPWKLRRRTLRQWPYTAAWASVMRVCVAVTTAMVKTP